MANLKVTAFNDGSVVRRSVSNPEFGSIQVKDESVKLVNGFIQKSNTSAFIRGKYDDLKALNLKAGQNISESLGNKKIIVKESLTPFYEGQQQKVNPSNGAICTSNGQPIYRETMIVDDNNQYIDELLKMDTIEVSVNKIQHEDIKM